MLSQEQIGQIQQAVLADLVGAIETHQGSVVVETPFGEIEYKWHNGGTTEIGYEDQETGEYHQLTFCVSVELETNTIA